MHRRIHAELTFKNPLRESTELFLNEYAARKIPQTVSFYESKDAGVYIPRGYTPSWLFAQALGADNKKYAPVTYSYLKVSTKPRGEYTLREPQKNAVEVIRKAAKGGTYTGTLLLTLPTGAGKTLVGLHTAACSTKKTLIIVDRLTIERAWVKDAKKFFGWTEDSLGIIRGDKKQCRKVTIASIQTLHQMRPNRAFFDQFGTVIFDECQIIGAPLAYDLCTRIGSPLLIGLTATATREDGYDHMIGLCFGKPVICGLDSTDTILPVSEINLIPTKLELIDELTHTINQIKQSEPSRVRTPGCTLGSAPGCTRLTRASAHAPARAGSITTTKGFKKKKNKENREEEKRSNRTPYASAPARAHAHETGSVVFLSDEDNKLIQSAMGKKKKSLGLYFSNLFGLQASDPKRNKLISDSVEKIYRTIPGSVSLVAVKRTEQLEIISASLNSSGVPFEIITGAKNQEDKTHFDKVATDIGKGRCRVVIAIYSCVYKGTDIPALTDVFLASSFGKQSIIRQLVGRVRRKNGDKTRAVVHDFIDVRVPSMHRSFHRVRLPLYRSWGFHKRCSL